MSQTPDLFPQITTLMDEIRSLPKPTSVQQDKLDRKLRLEFHYNTNHIEGNTLTYGETMLLFLHDETRGTHTLREFEEMKASDVALQLVKDLAADDEQPLTETFIKNLNGILLKEPYWKDALTADGQPTRRQIKVGDYKEFPNSVRLASGEMFHYASPGETAVQMGELIDWYRNETDEIHPIVVAAMLHYRFVRIHPFDDGNGRLSRLLMNYVLLRAGYPLVVIKSAEKAEYLSALRDADAGNYDSFIGFIVKQVEWSLELVKKAVLGEDLEEMDDWKKEAELLKKEARSDFSSNLLKEQTVLLKLIQQKIIPFGENLKKELNVVSDLFTSTGFMSRTFSNMFDPEEGDYIMFSNETDYWSKLPDGSLIRINFSGFKKGSESYFDNYLEIKWIFKEFTYEVHYPCVQGTVNRTSIIKFYHQDLTPAEKAEIISESGKWILAEIKKRLA